MSSINKICRSLSQSCPRLDKIVLGPMAQIESTRSSAYSCTRCLHNGSSMRPFVVSVEGNIASGKTRLLDHFSKTSGVKVWPEPVDRWRDIRGSNALGLMYEDPRRWSMTLQTYVQLTMTQTHMAPQIEPVKLMERSIFSAKYCFTENLYQSGKMAEVDYQVLSEWFDWIISSNNCNVDLIVYLRTKPETCHERIGRRCRNEERTIPMEYLESLNELYDDWLIRRTNQKTVLPANLLVLDANQEWTEMEELYRKHQDQILHSSSYTQ